jgi:hypothetical protein
MAERADSCPETSRQETIRLPLPGAYRLHPNRMSFLVFRVPDEQIDSQPCQGLGLFSSGGQRIGRGIVAQSLTPAWEFR